MRAATGGHCGILHGVKHCRAKLLAVRADRTGGWVAKIAYTFEDYRTTNDQFCMKTYVTPCKTWNSKIDPFDNTTRRVYDDLNRVIEQVNQFDDENARASRTTPRDGTATWHAARSPT